jgi:hypothetical protein
VRDSEEELSGLFLFLEWLAKLELTYQPSTPAAHTRTMAKVLSAAVWRLEVGRAG